MSHKITSFESCIFVFVSYHSVIFAVAVVIVESAYSIRAVKELLLWCSLAVSILDRIASQLLKGIYRILRLQLLDQLIRKDSVRDPIRALPDIRSSLRNTPTPATVWNLRVVIFLKERLAILEAILLDTIGEIGGWKNRLLLECLHCSLNLFKNYMILM